MKTIETKKFDANHDMIINDILIYLIQFDYAIVDMNFDESNEQYTINLVRPHDCINNNLYIRFVAIVTTKIINDDLNNLDVTHIMKICQIDKK